jgi:SAM-dependent methyltransferase
VGSEQWDEAAATFDDEPDHGLTDPVVARAWRSLLLGVLPPAPARVADLGCGTGTLSRLLSEEGFVVDGVDFSERMVAQAQAKVLDACFVVADAADPPLPSGSYDVVLSRHVLWAMDDPQAAIRAWVRLLRPPGVLVLVEGNWSTGAGLTATQTEDLVRGVRGEVQVLPLPEEVYWGKPITDERYLALSRR